MYRVALSVATLKVRCCTTRESLVWGSYGTLANGLASVSYGPRRYVVEAFVVTLIVVVIDECPDLLFYGLFKELFGARNQLKQFNVEYDK